MHKRSDGEGASHIAADGFAVGRRLQAIRKSRGLSQRELARRAEMTNGTLSLIEQGKVSPSLQSLEKIVRAIPMTLPEFFHEQSDYDAPVVKESDSQCLLGKGYRAGLTAFNRAGARATYILEQTLDVDATTCTADWYDGNGRVVGICTEGTLELELAGVSYTLSTGDRFHFGAKQRHRFTNTGSTRAKAVLVVSPFEA